MTSASPLSAKGTAANTALPSAHELVGRRVEDRLWGSDHGRKIDAISQRADNSRTCYGFAGGEAEGGDQMRRIGKLFLGAARSGEHTSELQSHSFISYAVFCLNK